MGIDLIGLKCWIVPMRIEVGDRVSYPDVLVLGQPIIKSGVGTVLEVKGDPYGKTSRQIAIVKGRYGKTFETFTSALQIVNQRGKGS